MYQTLQLLRNHFEIGLLLFKFFLDLFVARVTQLFVFQVAA